MHPSTISKKNLFLHNYSAHALETSHKCSFGEALPKLFKEFNSMQNSVCHGNQKQKLQKSSSPKP